MVELAENWQEKLGSQGSDFENLCRDLLRCYNLEVTSRQPGGSDKGRDISVVSKIGDSEKDVENWIECKDHKNPLPLREIAPCVVFASTYEIQWLWIFSTSDANNPLQDTLKDRERNFDIKPNIVFVGPSQIEKLLSENPSVSEKYLDYRIKSKHHSHADPIFNIYSQKEKGDLRLYISIENYCNSILEDSIYLNNSNQRFDFFLPPFTKFESYLPYSNYSINSHTNKNRKIHYDEDNRAMPIFSDPTRIVSMIKQDLHQTKHICVQAKAGRGKTRIIEEIVNSNDIINKIILIDTIEMNDSEVLLDSLSEFYGTDEVLMYEFKRKSTILKNVLNPLIIIDNFHNASPTMLENVSFFIDSKTPLTFLCLSRPLKDYASFPASEFYDKYDKFFTEFAISDVDHKLRLEHFFLHQFSIDQSKALNKLYEGKSFQDVAASIRFIDQRGQLLRTADGKFKINNEQVLGESVNYRETVEEIINFIDHEISKLFYKIDVKELLAALALIEEGITEKYFRRIFGRKSDICLRILIESGLFSKPSLIYEGYSSVFLRFDHEKTREVLIDDLLKPHLEAGARLLLNAGSENGVTPERVALVRARFSKTVMDFRRSLTEAALILENITEEGNRSKGWRFSSEFRYLINLNERFRNERSVEEVKFFDRYLSQFIDHKKPKYFLISEDIEYMKNMSANLNAPHFLGKATFFEAMFLRKDPVEAEGSYKEALKYIEHDLDPEGYIRASNRLGVTYKHLGKVKLSIEKHSNAIRAAQQIKNPSLEAIGWREMGASQVEMWNLQEALKSWSSCYNISKKGKNKIECIHGASNLCFIKALIGENSDELYSDFQQVLIDSDRYGLDYISAKVRLNFGNWLIFCREDFQNGQEMLETANTMSEGYNFDIVQYLAEFSLAACKKITKGTETQLSNASKLILENRFIRNGRISYSIDWRFLNSIKLYKMMGDRYCKNLVRDSSNEHLTKFRNINNVKDFRKFEEKNPYFAKDSYVTYY